MKFYFGFFKSTWNNYKPYSDEDWHEKKMVFSILDSKLSEKFITKKMKLNPFDDALLA
jgi:hypothetical protein